MSRIVNIESFIEKYRDFEFFSGYQEYDNGFETGVSFLVEELENLPVLEWESAENPPKVDDMYLVYVRTSYGGYQTIAKWTSSYKRFEERFAGKAMWYKYDSEYGDYELTRVTHWMPLPVSPNT